MVMRMNNYHAHTAHLTKFIWKRELFNTIIWFILILSITVAVAIAFNNMYGGDPAARAQMVIAMKNPAMVAIAGPVYGLDNYTLGAMMNHEMAMFSIIAVAIMNIFIVVRNTRKDEEEGRSELIRSFPVGKLAPLNATIIVSLIINTIIAVATGLSLYVLGIEGMSLGPSLLYGAVLGISGFFFSAVTALFCQLASTSRGAVAYTFIFMGVAYILRAIGDVGNEAISYLSPIGIILRTATFVNNNWWPVLILLVLSIILIIVSFYFNMIRDLGSGFFPAKRGHNHASKFLTTPLGFSLKLLKSMLIGWTITMLVLGLTYGSIFADVDSFINSNEAMAQIFTMFGESDITRQFLTSIMLIMAIMATIPSAMAINRLRKEETLGRLEHLATKNLSKYNILGCFLTVAIISSILMMLASAVGIWGAQQVVMDTPIPFTEILNCALVYIPAIWLITGATVYLIAYHPRNIWFIWIYIGLAFLFVYFGELLSLPDWSIKLSIFSHIPKIPVEKFDLTSISVITFISIIITIIGFIGYKRRDIAN
jgi:ABC-2 type transport system permease protein